MKSGEWLGGQARGEDSFFSALCVSLCISLLMVGVGAGGSDRGVSLGFLLCPVTVGQSLTASSSWVIKWGYEVHL